MKRYLGISLAAFCSLLLVAGLALAKPAQVRNQMSPEETGEVDLVGDVDGSNPMPAKALQDTVWIADWTFDTVSGCASVAGWQKIDNRMLNDGSNYWFIGAAFDAVGGITTNAAILSNHNLCWTIQDGYGNNWDYSIVLKYRGTGSMLSFKFLSDSEPGFDFVTVEADSAGVSESLVNYSIDPQAASAAVYRQELVSFTGIQSAGSVDSLVLPDFSLPAITHEAYIRFSSDGGYADEDGFYPSNWGAGLIVDNIAVFGGAINYTESFEGALNANVTLVNSALALPFGEWARLFQHITDNDKCSENTTCAWLWTNPLKIATFPDMAFGPGSAVINSWLDDIIYSPWASLSSTPSATGTVLLWRRFAGNDFSKGNIVQQWSVRGKLKVDNTDTSTLGDSINCISNWGHASSWNSLTSFVWGTNLWDMTTFINPASTDVQLRLRVADAGLCYLFCSAPPITYNPGPGPYNDRIKIGRRVLSGPSWSVGIDTRTQAQDCFPTQLAPYVPGRHVEPNTDTSAPLFPYLFGTCDFSIGTELTINKTGPNLVTGDSIYADVVDARGTGGVTAVKWYGAIVAGPHAGKAPVGFTVGANGFFEVNADSSRGSSGTWVANRWMVTLDDTYFRGGDKLVYYWQATDAAAGKSSLPSGISGTPASVAAAENLTQGLFEVSYLPTINWDAGYLGRITADANGDLDPTGAEVALSSQKNCILYYQHVNSNRRSGEINRTSFMYALDRLGYRGYYDVYDVQGYGNTNNQLGGRATVAQASGYALIVEDDGRSNLTVNIPDGSDLDAQKINQTQWYRNYLAQGLTGRAGTAALWVIGENTAFEKATNALITTDLGLATIANNQGLSVNPDVSGVASATTWDGCTMSFAGDLFSLAGGCPAIRAYDAATATGTAVITHKYKAGAVLGNGAIIMNKNAGLRWNTVWTGFGWFDIRNTTGTPSSPDPSIKLLQKVLNCVLPLNCRKSPNVTDTGDDLTDALPRVSALLQNVPNPFNPTTTIKFDHAREGAVKLQVFDVAGHLVKTLVNGNMAAGRSIGVTWNGLSDAGTRVPSGVYFYQLVTDDMTATKKMVMMK